MGITLLIRTLQFVVVVVVVVVVAVAVVVVVVVFVAVVVFQQLCELLLQLSDLQSESNQQNDLYLNTSH